MIFLTGNGDISHMREAIWDVSQKDLPSGKVRTNPFGREHLLFFGTDKGEGSFPELEPSRKGWNPPGRDGGGRLLREGTFTLALSGWNHSDICKKGLYPLFSPLSPLATRLI